MMLKKALVAAVCATLLLAGIGLISPIGPMVSASSQPGLSASYLSSTDATGVWADNTPAAVGETVYFYLEIHNANVPSTAENVTVKVDLAHNSKAYVSASNHGQISDSTLISGLPVNSLLQYQSGSLKVTTDRDGDGVNEWDNHVWSNDSITTSGVNLGSLEGGSATVIKLSFATTVMLPGDPNLTVKFLSANNSRPADGWSDDTHANPGDAIWFYAEIHNTNVPSVAENVQVRVDFPNNQIGTVFNPTVYASYAPHTSHKTDQTKVTFSSNTRLTFRSGSLRVTWDQNGDGVYEYQDYAWPASPAGGPNGDNLIGNGIVLGDLWGCNPYIIQLSFWADSEIPETPENPDLTVNKKVVFQGNEYDSVAKETHLYDAREVVEYKIYVKNIGGQQATGVKVVDRLPAYIRTLDGHDTKEFLIGDLAAGAEWSGVYQARVAADLPQNDRTQENVATATSDNAGSAEDTAFIWINGPEILAAETAAAAVEQLPETGPALPVALALSGLLPVGVYLRRRLI